MALFRTAEIIKASKLPPEGVRAVENDRCGVFHSDCIFRSIRDLSYALRPACGRLGFLDRLEGPAVLGDGDTHCRGRCIPGRSCTTSGRSTGNRLAQR